jgi:hypothetical protein
MTMPASIVEDGFDNDTASIAPYNGWVRQTEWNILYDSEETNQDFLRQANMIPCYGCFAILPSSDFRDDLPAKQVDRDQSRRDTSVRGLPWRRLVGLWRIPHDFQSDHGERSKGRDGEN